MKKSSWTEKLHKDNGLPKIVVIPESQEKRWGSGTMAIPSPLEVNAIMKSVPRGKLTSINEIRKKVAKKHKTDVGCPITSGIFAWIAAHAAEEDRALGKKEITPYWRTLKGEGELNPKYPGGTDQQRVFLEGEGHKVIQKGKKLVVEDFEAKLV